jgi:hypothetical protein
MRRATVISLVGHGAILAWALISFSRALEPMPLESMAVDVISSDQLSKVTAGVEKAQKTETPKPFVEKIAEAKPAEDITSKIVEKKQVTATTDEQKPEPAPPKPEPKPAAAPPEPKNETKAADKKEPDKKVDPIAEALKKDEAKKPEKKAESKPQPVKKPEPQQPKFDPRKVAALLDKRDSTRLASAGSTLNPTPSLGASTGRDPTLSQNELDALRRRLTSNWTIPPNTPPNLQVRIMISLRPDGTLAAPPEVHTGSGNNQLRESTIRAIIRSQPFDMLRPSTYDTWKDLDITFVPRDLL